MQADLSHYRDHNRLLVVFAPSANDPRLIQQEAAYRREGPGMRDRDLIEIVVLPRVTRPRGLDAVGLRRRYHVARNAFETLLIGKDGTVAYRTKGFVAPKTLYGRIDAMPMRRDEMRRKGQLSLRRSAYCFPLALSTAIADTYPPSLIAVADTTV